MEQLPAAQSGKRAISWWEYPSVALIAVSALPAYAASTMAIIAWAVLKFHPAALQGTNIGAKLQAWADLARFFTMATAPVGLAICIVVSIGSFRSRATKRGWLIVAGAFLCWCVAGLLIGRP